MARPGAADVAETGVGWHELAAVKESRMTAFEDCVEAELTLGRHREVVGELAAMSEQEPVRERTCGLLMLALYRCGRQPETLAAYQRLRDSLVGDFGLDPGPELQDLERAILKQHPMLALPPLQVRAEAVRPPAPGRTERTAPLAAAPPLARGLAPVPPAAGPAPALAERKQVSVLLVRASLGAGADDPELPAAVRTIVAARLDTLPVAEKSVLRDAAVLGGTVWTAGVAAVGARAHREVDAALRLLERKDFLRRVRRSILQDDTEYVVRHRLVRDIGYAQLTRQDRLLRHRRAIGWITALPPQHGDLLIHHYRQLVALSATDAMVDEACQALVDAGRRAAAAGGHNSALRCYRAASDLCPSAAPGRRQLSLLYRQSLRATSATPTVDSICG